MKYLFPHPRHVVLAHCDTLDGPVVMAAKKALETQNPNYILIWVKEAGEDRVKSVFNEVLAQIRIAKTDKSRAASETRLFEELVKIHREGEGAKYEGLMPAGSVEPEIAVADRAIATRNLDEVLPLIHNQGNRDVIKHLFHKVIEKSTYEFDDVVSGREFVQAYVVFIHAVEKAIQGMILEADRLHVHH